jgi:lipoic acid synthetase
MGECEDRSTGARACEVEVSDLAAEGADAPYRHDEGSAGRMPAWLRRPLGAKGHVHEVEGLLGELSLNTVCRSAKCPNRGECYSSGTATFLIAGDACTRGCRFCAVETRAPEPLDADEPARVARAAARMGLAHVVVTMVTRDDLADGAAGHVAATVEAVRTGVPDAEIEVLTSDFAGRLESVELVAESAPDVFNHNVETVPRLYSSVRPGARYSRSLRVLGHACALGLTTKSGLMLGLGEGRNEVVSVMRDLRAAGVSMLTLGQYLRPSPAHLPVAAFVAPDIFAELGSQARELGFAAVASGPFVRSSYHARELAGERRS